MRSTVLNHFFFFFQAEDGIRDYKVTGVQTCALPIFSLVVQSLNDMFDMATARLHAARTHVPGAILGLLFVLALASALVVGYASARDQQRSWFRTWLFAVVIAICIFVILDLEHPRIGIVRVDEADRLLEELLAGMK